MPHKTYIILVNWNGWQDTLECLESVFNLSIDQFSVIVCDNGSKDGSLDRIIDWANGDRPARVSRASMSQYSLPRINKPLPYQLLSKTQSENESIDKDTPLVLIDCGDNLGFAGGNNVGLRYALLQEDMAWCWLLNNDTVVEHNALMELKIKMERRPDAGIAGSTLIYYHQTDKIQAFGGARYFSFFGIAMHIGRFFNYKHTVNEQQIENQMDYVIGASMFTSRSFIENVGLMSEDYFLYYEELDWALRARGKFSQIYAQKSLVFHKAGASIGSSNKVSSRSLLSDSYLMSNRLKITRRFFPHYLMSVSFFLMLEAGIRLFQGKKEHAYMIFQLIIKQYKQ